MLTYFSDPSPGLYIVLGALVIILGLMALRRQQRKDVINFVIGAAVLLAVFLIDRTNASPREEVEQAVNEIRAAAKKGDYDEVFKHVSESFNYKGKDKNAARQAAESAKGYFPDGISIWEPKRAGFNKIDDTTAEQEFDAQFVNAPQTRHRCIGVFKNEGGVWKMTSFRLYPVVGETDREVTPPGL